MNQRASHITKRTAFSRKAAKVFLCGCLLIGLLAPFIANHLPLAASVQGTWMFPAFDADGQTETQQGIIHYETTDWSTLSDATVIFAPIRYSPGASDFSDTGYSPPFAKHLAPSKGNHWLGTGKRGDDILAGIIHGARVSMFVAIFSMLIAGAIGIFLGAAAGYLGDQHCKVHKGGFWLMIAGVLPAGFYAGKISAMLAASSSLILTSVIFLLVFLLILFALHTFGKRIFNQNQHNNQITFPLDTMIMKVIELVSSLPVLLLILAIASITAPAIQNLVWIIGLTSWTEIARLTRAEVLKLRETDFIASAKATGMPVGRILKNHLIPNAMTPVYVALAFGAGGAILAESGLSFLGVGVPPETVTWGKIIAEGRQNFDAWWMILFPGFMISATVMSFYALVKKA